MFDMIKFYNQKSNNYQFSLCEIRRQLLQMFATGDYYVCFCDGKMFEASKKSNDFVILTNLKSGVYAEIQVDSLVRGIRLGLFLLQVVIFTR